jgi:uncharacterized protein (TIGR02118 family)
MIQLTVLYGHPQNPAAFDRHYREKHVPLAQKLPGLKGYLVNKPAALSPEESSPYHLIADLYFESMAAFQAALQSPEGQAAAGDLANFADGGVTLLMGEIEVYNHVSVG